MVERHPIEVKFGGSQDSIEERYINFQLFRFLASGPEARFISATIMWEEWNLMKKLLERLCEAPAFVWRFELRNEWAQIRSND